MHFVTTDSTKEQLAFASKKKKEQLAFFRNKDIFWCNQITLCCLKQRSGVQLHHRKPYFQGCTSFFFSFKSQAHENQKQDMMKKKQENEKIIRAKGYSAERCNMQIFSNTNHIYMVYKRRSLPAAPLLATPAAPGLAHADDPPEPMRHAPHRLLQPAFVCRHSALPATRRRRPLVQVPLIVPRRPERIGPGQWQRASGQVVPHVALDQGEVHLHKSTSALRTMNGFMYIACI